MIHRKIILTAICSAILGTVLGACVFTKNKETTSPLQLLQLLAQVTNCWISAGTTATTTCSIGIGGATPNENTKLAVNGRISSSVLGVYCGKTPSTYDGAQVGGYAGAKLKCETACGNANAHLCTSHEVSISLSLGLSVPGPVWYSGAVWVTPDGGATSIVDCSAWTVNNTTKAVVWSGTNYSYDNCSLSRALMCCL